MAWRGGRRLARKMGRHGINGDDYLRSAVKNLATSLSINIDMESVPVGSVVVIIG